MEKTSRNENVILETKSLLVKLGSRLDTDEEGNRTKEITQNVTEIEDGKY